MNRENVKRYFVFAYDLHYPAGGMGDFVRAFTDLGDAKIYAQRVDSRSGIDARDRVEIWDMWKLEELPWD